MNRNERNSRKKYDSIADVYDFTKEGQFTLRYRSKISELCEIKDGYRVLDVGCGNGSLINALSSKAFALGTKARIEAFGIDISPNMIEECKKRYTDITFTVGTGEKLEFEDSFFDVVVICCALHHLHNPLVFFEEAYRVLKVGGVLIVAEPWNPFPIKQLMDLVMPLLKSGDNKLFSRKQLYRLFIENGFLILKSSYEQDFMQVIIGRKLITE